MKTTFKFIIAAMAAVSVFTSCQKEMNIETANNTNDAVRVISAQFDNSTKASLDGFKPSFENNDEIRVSNSEKSEVCKVSVSGSTVSFTTTLSGALTAIYPAAAAVLSSDAADAPIAASNNIKVLAVQSGSVKDAIIAKATVAEGGNTATFEGQTALFAITPPAGATAITITSLKTVVSGARTGDAVAINTTGEDAAAKCVINVTVPTGGTAYVSLVPGVNLTDLSFDAGGTYGMKGIPTSKLGTHADATATNTEYSIDNENWHTYVIINGLKWATSNIGATDSNPYGTYFMWGETNGITPSGNSFSFPTTKYYTAGNNSWSQSSGFVWKNCPWTDGEYKDSQKNVFTKYTRSNVCAKSGTADNKTKLDLADDAAYANWGGAWRMPTGGTDASAEFTALAKAANASYTSSTLSYNQTITTSGAPSNQGVYYYNVSGETVGVYFVDADKNLLFFPAAGYGNDISLSDAGSRGFYWSSSLPTSYTTYACNLGFSSSLANPQNDRSNRYGGFPVRPVSD